MKDMPIEDAVKRFQKEWNSYEYARLQKELAKMKKGLYEYGIVNMNDKSLWGDSSEMAINAYERLDDLKQKVKQYSKDPEPIKFKIEQKQKYGDLYLGRPSRSWEKTDGELVWHKWASVDLGSSDFDRRGGLMKYSGYGRAEPKKYLRGHLYPKTIIKEGWIPKKHKDKVGKPYGDPLQGAKDSKGRLSEYGPEYYI